MDFWKDIPNYEGLYQVSYTGLVKSLERTCWNGKGNYTLKGKILKQTKINSGYLKVNLYKDKKQKSFGAHVLVAMAFHDHVPDGHNLVVDHKDGNKLNNHKDNLWIVSQGENCIKSIKNKTSRFTGVCRSGKKWKAHIRNGGKSRYLGRFETEEEAYEAYQKELNNE